VEAFRAGEGSIGKISALNGNELEHARAHMCQDAVVMDVTPWNNAEGLKTYQGSSCIQRA
jgi:hypothetical protein